ncbi:Do family serine endopeptidase [Flaviaesturariibacter terrae]
MKRYLLQGLVVAGALVALPAFAQKDKTKDKDKQVQTIVITRDGNIDEKTVIEIKGNQVLVNGKEADKSPDVNVNVTTVKRGGHVSINGIGGRNTWVYNDNDEGPNFFTEDEHRAMLGVVTDLVEKGAQISSVTKGSAAEKAGLKKDDIITSIDNVQIKEDGDVSKAIRSHKPGDKVKITFLRDGKEQTVNAELSTWKGLNTFNLRVPSFHMEVPVPPATPGGSYYYRSADRPRLGVSIQDTEDGKGVKVTDVDEETPAAKAGIQENDIIIKVDDQAIDGTDDLRRITQRARQGSTFTFTILRGGKEQKVDVKYPRELKSANL